MYQCNYLMKIAILNSHENWKLETSVFKVVKNILPTSIFFNELDRLPQFHHPLVLKRQINQIRIL